MQNRTTHTQCNVKLQKFAQACLFFFSQAWMIETECNMTHLCAFWWQLFESVYEAFRYHSNSFIAKRVISIFVNLRYVYLRLKLLNHKENNKKICDTFDHNFYIIPLYITNKVYQSKGIILYYMMVPLPKKFQKMALNPFCDETLLVNPDNMIKLKKKKLFRKT